MRTSAAGDVGRSNKLLEHSVFHIVTIPSEVAQYYAQSAHTMVSVLPSDGARKNKYG